MNAIDGTDRHAKFHAAPPPSLLVTILDTNPFAWDELSSVLTLKQTVANLQIFVNSHLAINHANKVAIIASHPDRASFLHPIARTNPVTSAAKRINGHVDKDVNMTDAGPETPDFIDAANKYRPFAVVERELLASLSELFASTDADVLANDGNNTMIAGSLTMALAHISKLGMAYWPTSDSIMDNSNSDSNSNKNSTNNGMAPSANAADVSDNTNFAPKAALTARILILSVSGDLAGQYIPVMNAVFAAQRLRIPIDVLKLAGDTAFLQQASDATGGVYIAPHTPQGMLQYLMMAFLPDQTARQWLVPAVESAVDFRAACFCHRNVITTGFVCSVCLSIFCKPLQDSVCLTCGSRLELSAAQSFVPAVIPRKKKKKKKDGSQAVSRSDTPSAK